MTNLTGELTKCPWVIVKLGERLLGIPSLYVMEMLVVPKLSHLPMAPEHVKGAMNLRDQVIMLIDLRKKLGYTSVAKEVEDLVQLMHDREQDHKNWLKELEGSIKENREFKLATDPHKCKFGIWYDSYKPTNMMMENHLKKFDEPHSKIHGLAGITINMVKKNQKEEALKIIEEEHDRTLALMIKLFEEARNLIKETSREIALVLSYEGKTMAATVDAVESVEYLKEGSVEELGGIVRSTDESVVSETAKLVRSDKLVMLVDTPMLFKDLGMMEPSVKESLETAKED